MIHRKRERNCISRKILFDKTTFSMFCNEMIWNDLKRLFQTTSIENFLIKDNYKYEEIYHFSGKDHVKIRENHFKYKNNFKIRT